MALQDFASRLAQDPRNRLIRVAWAVGGGLVFMRVTMDYTGNAATIPDPAPEGIAAVTGLPWGNFDLFDRANTIEDPDARSISNAIVDPASASMLSKFYQWTPSDAIRVDADTRTPGETFWVIDETTWTGILNNFFLDRVAYGRREDVRMLLATSLYSSNPSLKLTPPDFPEFGVAYVDNVWRDLPGPPDQSFFANGGTAHEETNPPQTIRTRKQRAILIINAGKITKLLPKNALGKKPRTITFNVRMNEFDGKKGSLTWQLSAQGYALLKGSRRSFPVDAEYKPTWSGFPDAKAELTNPTDKPSVDVTIDLVTLKVSMKLNGRGQTNAG